MKKLFLSLTLAGLLALALGGATSAHGNPSIFSPAWVALADQVIPTVSALDPASAANDIDTHVTITGADFTAVMDSTGTVVVTSPTASLGSTTLKNVAWVNATTLTATVPWGIDPGSYPLTVTNPDGGTATLPNAFTVTQGIGQWNGGELDGGPVLNLAMKPGDPNTLYALANPVGIFRSTDGGENWRFVFSGGLCSDDLVVDPHHPSSLYFYACQGLYRSQDEGDTWTRLMDNAWPDGRIPDLPRVYLSPSDPQLLFVSSGHDPAERGSPGADALGLIRSSDGGATWGIVSGLEGIGVQDVAFDPTDHLKMVLATSDARVFHSTNGGANWSEVTTKPPLSSLGFRGVITYNPYRPTEVWIASMTPGGIYKSTDAAFSSWQDVTPANDSFGSSFLTFTGADSVYIVNEHSADGGSSWSVFGPDSGSGQIIFDPNNSQIGYVGSALYGVEKTTDGGTTWAVKNKGLMGMHSTSMEVSRADSQRVYATFTNWSGIFRSNDGANHWTFLPFADSSGAGVVREDPFIPNRLYAASGSGFYMSTNQGEDWSSQVWNVDPSLPGLHSPDALVFDPVHPGHLVVGFRASSSPIVGAVYTSSDYGASWQGATLPQSINQITSIVFDPATPGVAYLTTGWSGVYKSTNSGASWTRIDDQSQQDMAEVPSIAVATHPQHMLFVASNFGSFRSTDGGATWQAANRPLAADNRVMFVDGDSSRLYDGTSDGLYFSSDTGDTWSRAAGALGSLEISALASATADGHSILYAATNGGAAGTTSSTAAATPRTSLTTASAIRSAVTDGGAAGTTSGTPAEIPWTSLATASGLVDAGIYRYALLPAPTVTSFTPTSGPVSTSVTLTGTGFTGATKVAFHGTAATSFTVASATKITATVPSGASTGTIAVTTAGGTGTSATSFTVSIPSPPQTTKKPPQTKITKAKINSRKRMATFKFVGSGGMKPYRFQCKLDKKKYSSCRSAKTYKHLEPGKHSFRVRAKDHAGRVDKTPAIKKFKIKH